MKPIQWIVFDDGDGIRALKDDHKGLEGILKEQMGCEVLGTPCMETAKDAINYIQVIRGL